MDDIVELVIVEDEPGQTWTVSEIAEKDTPLTWEKVFENAREDIDHASKIIERDQESIDIYPLKKDIFNAFKYTPLEDVKVVIVGQDPYPQAITIDGISMPRAVGLSFSVRREDKIPMSLNNIYKELVNCIPGFVKPNHGDLRSWARQGVLLLNMCLTVRAGLPGSHGAIWLGFIKKVLTAVTEHNPKCIFVLWGKEAQNIKPLISDNCIFLETSHPSGFSANRGFLGSNHFRLINEELVKQDKEPINW